MNHKTLALWYLQLAKSQEVGLPLAQAIETSSGPPQKELHKLVQLLRSGTTVDDVLRQAPRWLSEADRLFISAGAQTGRLPP